MLCDRLHALWLTKITVNNFADLFNCTPVGRASDLMRLRHKALSWLGPDGLSLVGPLGLNCWTSVSPELVCC